MGNLQIKNTGLWTLIMAVHDEFFSMNERGQFQQCCCWLIQYSSPGLYLQFDKSGGFLASWK